MSNPRKLSELFSPPPHQWHLRGDPWLWRDLAQRVDAIPVPENAEAFVTWLESEFTHLVGASMSHSEIVFVKQYAHGGMSSGCIRPTFWRETVVPLLKKRFEERSI